MKKDTDICIYITRGIVRASGGSGGFDGWEWWSTRPIFPGIYTINFDGVIVTRGVLSD